jgi:hypothetical protein
VPDSQSPWIEIKRSSQEIKGNQGVSDIDQKNIWQAMFACHIGIRPYEERLKLKWGFNEAALLEEALDRQKLFLESQLFNNSIDVQIEQHTLSLRCSVFPKSGLLLGVVAKVLAESHEKVHSLALNYLKEIEAIFPYDYTIRPAKTAEEFNLLIGKNILEQCNDSNSIAKIRRFEQPLRTSMGIFRVLGLWQTGIRSDEQIWRALANYPHEIIFNVTLSPTTLFEDERRALLAMKKKGQIDPDKPIAEPYLKNFESWIEPFIDRHISPWNKYFYLQIHLVSTHAIDEFLFRSIGSAITRDHANQASPGFQVCHPLNSDSAVEWCNHLGNLNLIQTKDNMLLRRLSEIASLDETHAVFRLPYPPKPGFPNAVFLDELEEKSS